MKLSLAEYNALRNLLAHIVHGNREKDLTEIVDQFTGNALVTVLRAIEKIGEAVEQQDKIRFWQRQLEFFPNSKSVIKKLDGLLKVKDSD